MIALRALGEPVRRRDRLADGDVITDMIEQACRAISRLRPGAGRGQTNVEDREGKITQEAWSMREVTGTEAAAVREKSLVDS